MSADNLNDDSDERAQGGAPVSASVFWRESDADDLVQFTGKLSPEIAAAFDKLTVACHYVEDKKMKTRTITIYDSPIERIVLEQHRRVRLPPGHRLAVVAEFLLTRGAFKRYVAPVIADMQEEYIEAIAAGHEWHARWIAVRGHLLVIPNWLYAVIVGKLAALLRRGS